MNQIMVKMTDEMKQEFQSISKRRAENPSELVREWIKHYINEYKEQGEMLLTIKRTKSNDLVRGIDYIDEYELKHTVKIARNKIYDVVLEYNESVEKIDQEVNKQIKRILNLEITEVTLDTGDFTFHIKNELLDSTLYGLYKKLDSFVDLTSLSYRDIRFSYYLNLDGKYIILTKEGEELKEWTDDTTKHDIMEYLKSIQLDTFIRE